LFEVSRADVPPSFVFGTMHSSDKAILKLPPPVALALKSSQALLLEVVDGPELQASLARDMRLTDGRTLAEIVGPRVFRDIQAAAKRYGLSGDGLNTLRPWAVMFLFSVPKAEMLREAAGQTELDGALQDYAEKRGIAVVGLERAEDVTSFLSGLSDADQIAMLEITLRHNPNIETLFEIIKTAYLAGDLDALHRLSRELSTGADSRLNRLFERELIEARNARMIAAMRPYVEAGGAFIAVGALHLSGESGILGLLQRAGYRIKRVL
jgi:uncharacterized protein YbaP (TraB family)